jgi:hypothetical protein
MMKKITKKGGVLFQYTAGILLFSLVVICFYIIPAQQGGFWEAYQYTPPSNTITNLDKSSQIDKTITDISCDINNEDSCNTEQKSKFAQISDFINSMVQGAYGGLITIGKSFGISKTILLDSGQTLSIPPEITAIFVSLIIALLTITVLLIMFNRSDSV